MRETCANCGHPIERINYAMGPEWMHVTPGTSFPTAYKGTAWRFCKTAVATPKEAPDA